MNFSISAKTHTAYRAGMANQRMPLVRTACGSGRAKWQMENEKWQMENRRFL